MESGELDLLEIARVIKKRKRTIISLFLFGLAAGALWFFIGPTRYSGGITIEVGRAGSLDTDALERPLQIIEKVKEQSFVADVDFSGEHILDTYLVKFNITSKDYDKTQEVLEKIKNTVLEEHTEMFEKRRSVFEREKELLEEELKSLEQDISFFMLRGQQAADLKLQTYHILRQLNSIEAEKENIINTKIIDKPIIEERPGYLVVVWGGLLGLFLGLVLAFFKEFIEKRRGII